ncbi:MAG: hypothetical protein AseanaTS_19480 [Candidatus Pelagadaptatus aseana]|uniref:hypothetical protein n=1 Tax=Candidatus Pelagadaptatus aseana TaxID=3120508 RepID=UPI0039B28242
MENKKISTTQIAKRAGLDSRDMFELLSGARWIKRNDQPKGENASKWLLTAKGEFEGGEYFTSDKFGTYIVWPEDVLKHPMLQELQDKPVTATALGKPFGVSGRLVNQVLAELGWMEKHINGWELTDAGKALGGQPVQHEKSGALYVIWPAELSGHKALMARIRALSLSEGEGEIDGEDDRDGGQCLDGHRSNTKAYTLIDNWLYINGLAHACDRPLPVENSNHCSDFYLPSARVFIEYWGGSSSPAQLSDKLAKLDLYRSHNLNLIELEDDDLANLDEVLARKLLSFGIKVY